MSDALEVELAADAGVRPAAAENVVVGERQYMRVHVVVTFRI